MTLSAARVQGEAALRSRVAGLSRVEPAAVVGLLSVGALLALELYAASTRYGLRVTSDAPTFLPLLRDLALHPLSGATPFLAGGAETAQATPYMQLLAWLWQLVSPDRDLVDPEGAYGMLAVVGCATTLLFLHAFFLWARREAGRRVAFLALPSLLLLFGPPLVIWAGDLTFHGFLYSSFYPQVVGLAFLLYTLVVLDGEPSPRRLGGATILVAATMAVHPFTGALLALLLAAEGCRHAAARTPGWWAASVPLVGGYGLAALWPAYSLDRALSAGGPRGTVLVLACAAAPFAVRAAPRVELSARMPDLHGAALGAACFGLLVAFGLAAWEVSLIASPNADPLVHANRLALYWVEDRERWLLMLATSAVGVVALARLARRGRVLPPIWLGGCLAIGLAGLAGLPVPVWWRFLLFAQIPLALGVADTLASARRAVRAVVATTLLFMLAFKVATLFGTSHRTTYFGDPLQPAYSLGTVIKPGTRGLVASDPFTSYYVPAATGHRVLTVTKAHVSSESELAHSARGYRLLHEFYGGDHWWQAALAMWRQGVRYVVVEHSTSLDPPTLAEFSTGPTPLVRTAAARERLGTYFYRNNRVGTLVDDSPTYAIYRLESRKLMPRAHAPRGAVLR